MSLSISSIKESILSGGLDKATNSETNQYILTLKNGKKYIVTVTVKLAKEGVIESVSRNDASTSLWDKIKTSIAKLLGTRNSDRIIKAFNEIDKSQIPTLLNNKQPNDQSTLDMHSIKIAHNNYESELIKNDDNEVFSKNEGDVMECKKTLPKIDDFDICDNAPGYNDFRSLNNCTHDKNERSHSRLFKNNHGTTFDIVHYDEDKFSYSYMNTNNNNDNHENKIRINVNKDDMEKSWPIVAKYLLGRGSPIETFKIPRVPEECSKKLTDGSQYTIYMDINDHFNSKQHFDYFNKIKVMMLHIENELENANIRVGDINALDKKIGKYTSYRNDGSYQGDEKQEKYKAILKAGKQNFIEGIFNILDMTKGNPPEKLGAHK